MTLDQDIWIVVAAAVILAMGITWSRDPKFKIRSALVLIDIGAVELALVAAGSFSAILTIVNPRPGVRFIPDYWGLELFLPLVIAFALASVGYGTWCLARNVQKSEVLTA